MIVPLTVVGILLILLTIGPFLIPVPPLEDSVAPQDLADPDSRFIDVGGLLVHYKVSGQGRPAFVVLHGFGASTFSWRKVMDLGERGTVVAFDRPAFGLTERPMLKEWKGQNPYTPKSQVELTLGLMDALGIEQAILVGHSAGGRIATLVALTRPERIKALILVDPAVHAGGGAPRWIQPLLNTPQMRRLGPLIVRSAVQRRDNLLERAWHDPAKFTAQDWEGYLKPLRANNWDRALWELTRVSRASDLVERLHEVTVPALVITGDDDRIVPTEQSVRLADELPNVGLAVLPSCGHVPQEECPGAFLQVVRAFLDELRQTSS